MDKEIEIPFGAKDSELKGWEYTIPEGMEAEIKDGKIIVKQKESEDNRIRKEIIEFINWAESRGSVRNDWHQKKCPEEWIAYLERQKEQKTDCKYGCGLTDEQLMATDFWKEYLKESIIPGNKPTKADIDFLLPIARKYFSLVMKEACTICKEWSNGYQKGLEAAEQQPAEWSEEDENTLNDAITAVDMMLTDNYKESHPNLFKAFLTAKSWLKSLPERFNLQSKQEWNEEDEIMLQRVLLSLQSLIEEAAAPGYIECIKKEINWLKHLRPQPHWKPSKKQMEALEDAFRKDGGNEYRKVINSLYCDLQKLL